MVKSRMILQITFLKEQMYTIMKKQISLTSILLVLFISNYCFGQLQISNQEKPLDLTFINVETKNMVFNGEAAIYGKATATENGTSMILINDVELSNGIIEFDLAGSRSKDSNPMSRGFLGLAFRISENNAAYDCFYLRAANGRAKTQLQRNHTVQYIALPDFEWRKLRTETPGKYETYVDMVPLEWTHVKIIIENDSAEIYVHNATQPTLVVEELLGTEKNGKLGLWVGPGTDAYFANLKITKTN